MTSNSTSTFNCYKFFTGVEISIWDQVNMVFYNIIPFLIMVTFNSLLIINLRKKFSKRTEHGPNSSSSKRPGLTVSLIILSFLFLIMTTPGTIMFAYFYNAFLSNLDESMVFLIDDISFLNHSMLFVISFISNKKFRKTILALGDCFKHKEANNTTTNSKHTWETF